jgi:hypothetical protein
MKTFRELFCVAHHCGDDEFLPRVFWSCLYRQALPLARVIQVLNPEYFSPDRDFIAYAGRATNVRELEVEIRDYVKDYRNRTWWRGGLRMRVSAYRLRHLAADHFRADPKRVLATPAATAVAERP